ncbi:uncharacterized protein LOC134291734 [Aedes albopictus]|uniref:PHD-type domain-containing protein n=1 Tax=Aedes albopictus TaxID=7160 RepID=A0ABM1Y220_AEDAL
MASQRSKESSQGRRPAGADGTLADVGDANPGTSDTNHPEQVHPETTSQLENAAQARQQGLAVQQKVVQRESESQSAVIADPPLNDQVKVDGMVSTEKGAVRRPLQTQSSAANNKDQNKLSHSLTRPMPVLPNTFQPRRNPLRRVRQKIISSCGLCETPDDDNMVQCDECELWFHFYCVEVTESIAEVSWFCPGCANVTIMKTPSEVSKAKCISKTSAVTRIQQYVNPPRNEAASNKSAGRSSRRSETARKIELQLQKLEEERKLQLKYLEQKYSLLEELESERSSAASDQESFTENASKIQQWLKDTEHYEDDSGLVDVLAEDDLEAIYCLDGDPEPSNSRQNSDARKVFPAQRVRSSVRFSKADSGIFGQQQIPISSFQRSQRPSNVRPEVRSQSMSRRATDTFVDGANFIPRQRSTPVQQRRIREAPVSTDGGDFVYSLNRNQLAARQAVSKDLPEFSGSPEDWPLFFSMFNSSTQLCGFSNEENMLRLRKCLTGKALEAVKCRLLHPSNVHGVISTLKMLYGRPETIIQAIVRKIRALQSPIIERLDTVIQFALSVENLVATVEACEIGDFMYNASLRYELVERLPPTLRLDWAKTSRDNPSPNLADFSLWLRSIAEDASAVSIPAGVESRTRSGKKDGYLNLHAEEDQLAERLTTIEVTSKTFIPKESAKECVGCRGSCTTLAQCERFNGFSCDSRWAVVREFKLCRKCLRKHNGPCKLKKECGTHGCTYLHHPLLHSEMKESNTLASVPTPPSIQSTTTTNSSCNVHQGQSEILFRIVPVLLHGPRKSLRTYAFVDDGSELTLMEHGLADELGVEGPQRSLCLRWTGGANRTESLSQVVNLEISGVVNPTKMFPLADVYTVETLQLRPQTLLVPEMQKKYRHLEGLPLESYKDVSPRLLIGLAHASLGNAIKCREGKPNEPIAIKTRLGWTIYGSCSRDTDTYGHINHHCVQLCQCNHKQDESLNEAMKQYFSLESLGVSVTNATREVH